jgi:phosphoglycolate phosphatase-like HAD superfamily hydrolase
MLLPFNQKRNHQHMARLIVIDLDKPLLEVNAQLAQAFVAIRQKHGLDSVALLIQNLMTQVAMGEWEAKAPGSIGLLKRVHRAFANPPAEG